MDEQTRLVEKLLQRQGTTSDREFARRLGVSYARWQQVKAGDPAGMRFLRGVVQAYPDLALDCAGLFFSKPEVKHEVPAGT